MKASRNAGYSGTPLAKKLGIKDAHCVLLIEPPENYEDWLEPLPAHVRFVNRPDSKVDVAHVFVTERTALSKHLNALRKKLKPAAAVWISWPKKSAKVATNITETTIREVALPLGFVDIKVCAVNEVWSGLKLVVRKELR